MNILLAGDSWGVGVFAGKGTNYGPTGQGIQSILEQQGHHVTNISKGGGANYLMIDRLNGSWGNTGRCLFGMEPNKKINIDFNHVDHIVFLQTDIFRERHYYGKQHPTDTNTNWKVLEQAFVESLVAYQSIDHIIVEYFNNFYRDLNEIGKKYNKNILMIGGWSQLHPSISDYSNLIAVLPSATKLLIPELKEDCYLSDAEWYTQLDQHKQFMSKFNLEFKKMALVHAEKLKLVYSHWNEVHPGLDGYQRIVDTFLPYFGKNI